MRQRPASLIPSKALPQAQLQERIGLHLCRTALSSIARRTHRDCLVCTKAFASLEECIVTNAKLFCPCGSWLGHPVTLYQSIVGSVSVLFFHGRPSAIFFGVVAIGVDAIYRLAIWPVTHVANE
jgi:hypothetical protein